jgi:molybdopterin-guanine dinucleotide biosynthesis protein A
MGRNKALLPIEGKLLWQRQHALLVSAGASPVLISLRQAEDWVPPAFRVILDSSDAGPLGGLRAALHAAATTHLMVLAVDLPLLPATWFERLCARCEPGVGAIGQHANGSFEPLAAVYPREIQHLVEDGLRRGQYALQALAERGVAAGQLTPVRITTQREIWFSNWNSPEDVKPGPAGV